MVAHSGLLVPALVALVSIPAAAGEFAVLKEEIVTARKTLVEMVLNSGKRGPEQQKRVKDTADAVSARFSKLKAPPGKGTEFKELQDTWEAFKKTREKELVPAILANDKEKVEKLGAVKQKQRLDRIYVLIDILEK